MANPFLWLITPSIIFEELFEKCCYSFSNNITANFIFAVIFWVVIIALINKIYKKCKYKK